MEAVMARELTYQERIDALRATKLAQTQEKQQVIGAMDYDDWALILPPPDRRVLIDTISPSGVPIKDVLLEGFEMKPNHPSGGVFGPKATGENFRALLECHPTYIDPGISTKAAWRRPSASSGGISTWAEARST